MHLTLPVRFLVGLVLAMLAVASRADTVTRQSGESIAAFAARQAPNPQSEVVHLGESRLWGFSSPVVIAFYEYPVTFASSKKYYGDKPEDHELMGVVFIPTSLSEYQRIEVDSYGPEGANAEVVGVSFAPMSRNPAPALIVRVDWHNNHAVLQQECAYLNPTLSLAQSKLKRLNTKRCRIHRDA